jgi:PAS domain S-box-containing protein
MLYTLPDALPVGVFHTDAAGLCLYVNKSWCELAGLSRDEALGNGWQRALHHEDRDRLAEEWRQIVIAGGNFHSEVRFKRPDSSVIWVLSQGGATRDAQGAVTGYVGTVVDITESRQMESALRESEGHYRDLVEHSQDLMCTHDLDGRILSINAAAVRISGYDAQFFVNRNIRDFLVDKYREQFDSYLATIRRDGVAHGVMKVYTRTGEKRIWEYHNTLRTTGVEAPIIRGMARDITEEKRAQEAIARLASIVESSYDAIVGHSPDGVITSWNGGAERTFGYSAAEAQGQPISMLVPAKGRVEFANVVEILYRDGKIHHYESEWRRKGGEPIQVSLTMSAIKNASGKMIGASTIARDITERKRAEVERERLLSFEQAARRDAEAANRTKDEFLAVVSHELRTPLTSILGWARQIRKGGLDTQKAAAALETIERNARIQAQLIADILDVSRIISGNLRLEVQPVDVAGVIRTAIETIRPAAENKRIRLETALEPGITISGDANRLQQIVWNLLSNAVKFTPNGGRVEARLDSAGGRARIFVSDTGQGINPHFLSQVFERFSQSDTSTTRKHGGLGLGLAIVRQLVELHGGTIHAESPGQGKGATFRVELPVREIRQSTVAHQTAAAPQPQGLQGLKILVVDDDPDILAMIESILQECRADVKTCGSAGEALEAARNWRPDLLISDIAMPGEDGCSLIRNLRTWKPEAGGSIPAAALSARVRAEDRVRALSAGFQMFIPKPIEPEDFIAAVATLSRSRITDN